jgi:hypothetical protein
MSDFKRTQLYGSSRKNLIYDSFVAQEQVSVSHKIKVFKNYFYYLSSLYIVSLVQNNTFDTLNYDFKRIRPYFQHSSSV